MAAKRKTKAKKVRAANEKRRPKLYVYQVRIPTYEEWEVTACDAKEARRMAEDCEGIHLGNCRAGRKSTTKISLVKE